jgi:hypothetical protein
MLTEFLEMIGAPSTITVTGIVSFCKTSTNQFLTYLFSDQIVLAI